MDIYLLKTVDSSKSATPRARSENGVQFGASEKADALFQAAQRHSIRVRVLKSALPVAAIAVAAVFTWYTFLAAPAATVKIHIGDGAENGKLVMASPNLTGFSNDNLPYKMTATKATQDVSASGVIILEGINAELPIGLHRRAFIEAASGVYDNANGRLQFNKDFTVTTNDGLRAKLQTADVNISTGQITTDKPVDIQNGNMHIVANRMQMQQGGGILVFDGQVSLKIDPEQTPSEDGLK